jgi:hypothetical protein
MRIGFVTQLLWHRYGVFWSRLFQELEAELFFAEPDATLKMLSQDPRLEAIPSLSFQLAVAQSLSLSDVDWLVVPKLSEADSSVKGSGQDPWIANFPETLATHFAGLPSIVALPASLEGDIESVATTQLLKLFREPALVRRAWERHKGRLKPTRYEEPRWQKRASEKETIAVIAQPWLKPELYLKPSEDSLVIYQSALNPIKLIEEGQRIDAKLISSDQEVLGAARLLSRKGAIDRLIFVADKQAGADIKLFERCQKAIRKPLELVYLQDLVTPEGLLIQA